LNLQVLEHIPSQHEAVALSNLARAANEGMVLSWAVPGQAGHYHVNLQSSESECSLNVLPVRAVVNRVALIDF
jgi:hypothetical protein